MVESLPPSAGDTSLIPGGGTEVPHAARELSPCAATREASKAQHAPQAKQASKAGRLGLVEGGEKHVPGGDNSSCEGAAGGWSPQPGGGACWELAIRPWTRVACRLLCPLSQARERKSPPMDGWLSWPAPCPGPLGELRGQVQAPPLPVGKHWGWPESLILSLCTSKPAAQMEWGVEEGPRWGWRPERRLPGTKIT